MSSVCGKLPLHILQLQVESLTADSLPSMPLHLLCTQQSQVSTVENCYLHPAGKRDMDIYLTWSRASPPYAERKHNGFYFF